MPKITDRQLLVLAYVPAEGENPQPSIEIHAACKMGQPNRSDCYCSAGIPGALMALRRKGLVKSIKAYWGTGNEVQMKSGKLVTIVQERNLYVRTFGN